MWEALVGSQTISVYYTEAVFSSSGLLLRCLVNARLIGHWLLGAKGPPGAVGFCGSRPLGWCLAQGPRWSLTTLLQGWKVAPLVTHTHFLQNKLHRVYLALEEKVEECQSY